MNTADIRQAILMAADKIERFPGQFKFRICSVPQGPGGCGCAIGWIGYFSGERPKECVFHVSERVLHVGHTDFYDRMDHLQAPGEYWLLRADDCAACLRRYADTYYPANPEQPWLADYLRRLSVAGKTGQYVGDVS